MVHSPPRVNGCEQHAIHTDLLRAPLLVEASRSYWQHWRPDLTANERATAAFEARWFGHQSLEWLRRLLSVLAKRFDAYPEAFAVLRQWQPNDPDVRRLICHWHLQLSDPVYRRFTGEFLEQRRQLPNPAIDRDVVAAWLTAMSDGKWSIATTNKIANNLLRASEEAGLCAGKSGSRQLRYPQVDDLALGYLLYLLRSIAITGSLIDNPYIVSVGLGEGFIEQRLRHLPGLGFRRMGDLLDFEWQFPDLASWAEASLCLNQGAPA